MISSKVCNTCGVEKPLSEYDKDPRIKKDGLFGQCKSCRRIAENVRKKRLREDKLLPIKPLLREAVDREIVHLLISEDLGVLLSWLRAPWNRTS